MKKRRIWLLVCLWGASLTLFALTVAAGNKRPAMTADTAYQKVTETASGEPSGVEAEGCLSESELGSLLGDKLAGVLTDVGVSVGEGNLTLYGTLTEDPSALLEKYPSLSPYELLLRLVGGAPVSATVGLTWTADGGFAASAEEVTLAGVPVSVGDLSALAEEAASAMNERGKGRSPYEIRKWELKKGGLYYAALLPDEASLCRLYPVPLT